MLNQRSADPRLGCTPAPTQGNTVRPPAENWVYVTVSGIRNVNQIRTLSKHFYLHHLLYITVDENSEKKIYCEAEITEIAEITHMRANVTAYFTQCCCK